MAAAMPELIFVTGPQQGERAVIMAATAVIGRSPVADVKLLDEAASREHVRFQLTRDGWVMENLSANGTLVNGKRYKKDKKILLDTGDVMGVGLETKILYVAPGDDPEEALDDWRGANPSAQPRPAETKARARAPRAAPAPPAAGEQPKAPPPPLAGKEKTAEKPAAQPQEDDGLAGPAAKGSKNLKVILLSLVLLGLVGFGAALMLRNETPNGDGRPSLSRLTAEQISAALEEPIERPPSPTKAAQALNLAVRSYENKNLWSRPGELYRCVKQFKLYRAYSQSIAFPKVQYERMALAASRELDAMVRDKYDAAWKYEMAKSYRASKQSFELLMRELPPDEVERDSAIDRVVLKDIKQHIRFLNSQIGKPQ
jgi:pSer/pThr/pTyr-binding forkhead associated (FHA) protein